MSTESILTHRAATLRLDTALGMGNPRPQAAEGEETASCSPRASPSGDPAPRPRSFPQPKLFHEFDLSFCNSLGGDERGIFDVANVCGKNKNKQEKKINK